ncbi:MAG: glycoside hydrolase family 2 TIM barrel-domain containing protein [Eubacteriales bacterium]|nr:glycoside hydrolase family 2 TIM barrel-domain containing protein [Eubacteriales bacterium]
MKHKKKMIALALTGGAALGLLLAADKDMRVRDAVSSLQLGKKKQTTVRKLCTVWSSKAKDGPDAVPLPEYPRPQMERDNWTCLNGWWKYAIWQGEKMPEETDGEILVPFSPEARRSGVNRVLQPGETLWYLRELEGLEVPAGQRLLLHFGAVDERCRVFWNGREVGVHRNGYLPFSFDVTEYVRTGINVLQVAVQDDTDHGTACRGKQTLEPGGMYYHAQSGIWQTVWMEQVPENYLTDFRITPKPGEETAELQLFFSTEKEMDVTVLVEGNPHHFTGLSGMTARIPVPAPRLWSPEEPNLYDIQIAVREKAEDPADPGSETDAVHSYFAMRSFGTGVDDAGRPCLLLNGKPYFFHGVLDQGYWPESLMTVPADDAYVFDISEMKKAGFNMLRKHVKIEAARWYYHCDRLGMVVWQDMVNGGGPVPKLLETYLPNIVPWICDHISDSRYRLLSREDAPARREFEEDLLTMIRTLYNCPCIGLWTPFNEGWGQFDALRLTERIRKEDPTRPVDHASGWFDQGGGDLRSIHNYFRPLKVEKDTRPCVLTEYGGINCMVPGHDMSEEVYGYQTSDRMEFPGKFSDLMEKIRGLHGQGLSGAVYTQVSDIEEETNGLLTYDRRVVKIDAGPG